MCQAGAVNKVSIAAERGAELPADLSALQRMRQPRARKVSLADLDDLRLGGQPAQRGAVQHPSAVPLKGSPLLARDVLGRLSREPRRRVPVVSGGPALAGLAPAFAASGHLLSLPPASSSATARPASSLATGTRNGEQET